MDEVENFFCQFSNPWALRVSGMGGYTSKCEKKSKSLHPTLQCTLYLLIKMGSTNKTYSTVVVGRTVGLHFTS